MSTEEDSKKSGLIYVILIGVLLIVVISIFTVPFAAIGLAVKKSGILGQNAAQEETPITAKPDKGKSADDLLALRAAVEKAASNSINTSAILPEKDGFQIQVAPPATIDTASSKVKDLLNKNHYQFVEAYDHEFIRIIVILKSSQWSEFSRMLGEATYIYGFDYKGPSETKSTTNSSDSTIAKIEIIRKPTR
jgi:hypothetical protein